MTNLNHVLKTTILSQEDNLNVIISVYTFYVGVLCI